MVCKVVAEEHEERDVCARGWEQRHQSLPRGCWLRTGRTGLFFKCTIAKTMGVSSRNLLPGGGSSQQRKLNRLQFDGGIGQPNNLRSPSDVPQGGSLQPCVTSK